MKKNNILIADDDSEFRRQLKIFLLYESEINVVGEASNGKQAKSKLYKLFLFNLRRIPGKFWCAFPVRPCKTPLLVSAWVLNFKILYDISLYKVLAICT